MNVIIGVLYWDSSNKTISTLIYDEEKFSILDKPALVSCKNANTKFDKNKADQIIDSFVKKIVDHCQGKNGIVRHKIVGRGSPVSSVNKRKKPNPDSVCVRKKLESDLSNNKNIKIEATRFKLEKKSLEIFKKALVQLGYFSDKRNEAFKHRLWATAIGATNNNLPKKLKKLYMFNKHYTKSTKEIQKQYEEFYKQI